jgi:hypothetical protein
MCWFRNFLEQSMPMRKMQMFSTSQLPTDHRNKIWLGKKRNFWQTRKEKGRVSQSKRRRKARNKKTAEKILKGKWKIHRIMSHKSMIFWTLAQRKSMCIHIRQRYSTWEASHKLKDRPSPNIICKPVNIKTTTMTSLFSKQKTSFPIFRGFRMWS